MSKIEFRVSWKREGMRRKSRRFTYRATAEKHIARLLDSDNDPHWKCGEGHGYYTGSGYHLDGTVENDWVPTCMPPIVEGPTLEWRIVGEWGA